MNTLTFEVSAEIEFQYDENSPEFKEALASFNELICDGDAVDMLRQVAGQLRQWGDHEMMIEGVGYVGIIGQNPPAHLYSGIQVSANYCDYRYF